MGEIIPYTIRPVGEIMDMKLPPQRFYATGVPLGETSIVAAPPGCGKSRWSAQTAACQIAGVPFCGMPLDPEPQRTLFLQAENSLHRLQSDLRGLLATFSDEQRQRVRENLFMTSLEGPFDGDITLSGDPDDVNLRRMTDAIERTQPSVVFVDPWSACCVDELASPAIRGTYMALRKACAASSNGPVTLILVCHSKVGYAAAAAAWGGEALGYVRGSKHLVGIARAQINMRNCELVRNGKVEQGIEMIYAKSNNGILHDPICIRLNPDTLVYERVLGFDHRGWQQTLERLAVSHSSQTPAQKAAAAEAALPSIGERVKQILTGEGPLTKERLVFHLIAEGIASSKRAACEVLRQLGEEGSIHFWASKPRTPYRFYTKEQLEAEA